MNSIIPDKYKENIRFRKFIRDMSKVSKQDVCTIGINYKIKLFAYSEHVGSEKLSYLKRSVLTYSLYDVGFTNGWYKLQLIANRSKKEKLTIILDDRISGSLYWEELPVGIREDCLNIKTIDIPHIDRHEDFLKRRMIHWIVEQSDYYKIDKVYRYRDTCTNIRFVWAILLKRKKNDDKKRKK